MRSTLSRLALILVLTPIVAASACANNDNVPIGADCANGFCDPPPLAPTDGGDASNDPEPTQVLACIGTECPAPYATCSPTDRCAVNLTNDPENCGACGISCNGYRDLHMSGHCVEGGCAFSCMSFGEGDAGTVFRDCNDFIDDGCEIEVMNDPNNCGVCGHKCDPGVRCIKGFCGCQAPKIDCNGECVDPTGDDFNCGKCDNVCSPPSTACDPMPPHTKYGCQSSKCEHLMCLGPYADCNNDLGKGCNSDGCETFVGDENNCGGCGIECGPDQKCLPDDKESLRCETTCESVELTRCRGECVDLLNDPSNCGACNISCFGGAWAHEIALCKRGMCTVECTTGFADCNGDPNDGCEINLASDATNCGGCGVKCDVANGQPCIEGKCLMVECDAGVVTK